MHEIGHGHRIFGHDGDADPRRQQRLEAAREHHEHQQQREHRGPDDEFAQRVVADLARGAQVLDCFTFAGGFALHAASAGAAQVHAIDQSEQAIAQARDFNRSYDWLVQKMVKWTTFGPRQAYLRAYHVCGNFTLLWWCKDRGNDGYNLLTWDVQPGRWIFVVMNADASIG